jgi:hypothetical protein
MEGSGRDVAVELREKLRSVERAPDSPMGRVLAASGIIVLLERDRQRAPWLSPTFRAARADQVLRSCRAFAAELRRFATPSKFFASFLFSGHCCL